MIKSILYYRQKEFIGYDTALGSGWLKKTTPKVHKPVP